MIDIHSHILPSIDDGAGNINQAIEMARQAVADGISTIVATPHGLGSNFAVSPMLRDQTLANFRRVLHDQGIPLTVLPGMECCIEARTLQDALAQPGCFMGETGGRHLLVELAPDLELSCLESLLFDAQLKQISLVLAHPERHPDIRSNFKLVTALVERGLLLQVNAGSLTGELGWWIGRTAKRLVCEGLVAAIASDAHGPVHRRPNLSRARYMVEKWMGIEVARQLVWDNPVRIIGQSL